MIKMYADYNYYTSEYLLGKVPAVLDAEFLFWEKQARREIDRYTFDRIKADSSLLTDNVKDCTCAIAELLYKANSLSEAAARDGVAGVMTSYSNDGQSASFDASQSIYTESGKRAEIKRLVYLYLGNTGLLYAGAGRCCC